MEPLQGFKLQRLISTRMRHVGFGKDSGLFPKGSMHSYFEDFRPKDHTLKGFQAILSLSPGYDLGLIEGAGLGTPNLLT